MRVCIKEIVLRSWSRLCYQCHKVERQRFNSYFSFNCGCSPYTHQDELQRCLVAWRVEDCRSLLKLSKLPYIAHVAAALFGLCRIFFLFLVLAAQLHSVQIFTVQNKAKTDLLHLLKHATYIFRSVWHNSRCRRRESSGIPRHCKKYPVNFKRMLAICHSRHICRSPAVPPDAYVQEAS